MSSAVGVFKNNRLLIGVMSGLLLFVVVLFLALFEYVEKEVDIGNSKAALRDPWLAASAFLGKQGYDVVVDERMERLETLDEFSTLIVSRDDFLITPESFNRVMNWVAKGGNLIIGFQDDEGYLAQGLHLSDDYVGASELEPLLTAAERLHEAEGDAATASDEDDESLDVSDSKKDDGDHEHTDKDHTHEESAETTRYCPPERAQQGRCKRRKLSEQMRAENAAARAAFEARKAEGAATDKKFVVPPEQAWAQDYVNSNRDTRTYVHFTGDEFDTYVDWRTYRTLIYSPPDADGLDAEDEPAVELEMPHVELVAQVGNDLLTHFMQFEAGSGTISVLVHTRIWQNERIGRLDHAYFLWSLVGPLDQPIALLHGRRMPSLFSLILKYLPEVLLAAVCLMLAHFVRRGWRLGPRIVSVYGVRRSLIEHVVASGVFLWGQDAQGTLLDPLRRSVQHQLMLQMGQGFDVANDKDWSRIYPDLLPKLNSGDQKVLRAELMQNKQDKKLSAQEFYRHVRLLQTLRKVL